MKTQCPYYGKSFKFPVCHNCKVLDKWLGLAHGHVFVRKEEFE